MMVEFASGSVNREFSKSLLNEIGVTGNKANSSLSNLNQTIISSILKDSEFLSSLAIDIMDRNLYERANDCRWWALTSYFREAFDDYRRCLRKLNFNLSRLPGLMGMEEVKVSSYTARHTWATLAKYCQVPEEVISEGLGHSSLEVTRTYLKSFEGEELNRANIVVNNYIITGEKRMWNEA